VETIVNSLKPFFNKGVEAMVREAATTGIIPAYHDGPCKSGTRSAPGFGSQLAQVGLAAGAKAGAFELSKTLLKSVPVVGSLLESAVSLVSLPFAHHKQAVATEQATLCQAVPDANTFLRGVDELVSTGQLDYNTAAQTLEQGYQNWLVEVQAIFKKKPCNAACDFAQAFRAAIEMRKQRYAVAAAQDSRGSNGLFGGSGGGSASQAAGGGTLTSALTPLLVSSGGGDGVAAPPPSVLLRAGFTPASQSRLALFVAVGLIAGLGFVAFQFIGGKK
jgi:hypothetical protein